MQTQVKPTPFVDVVVDDLDPMIARVRAEHARARHEECALAYASTAIEELAIKTNDWLVEHPGWRVKHQSLTCVPETADSHPVYAVLVTMEKGDR